MNSHVTNSAIIQTTVNDMTDINNNTEDIAGGSNVLADGTRNKTQSPRKKAAGKRIRIHNTQEFCRIAAYWLNQYGFAVVPANTSTDGKDTKPRLLTKDRFLQAHFAPPNTPIFDNSYTGFTIIDTPEYKFLFLDFDLHKRKTLSARMACQQLGISEDMFKAARFQTNRTGDSVHLLFRCDYDLARELRTDDKRFEQNSETAHKTSITSEQDSRIPEDVELKLQRGFGNVRLKPDKILYLKDRSEFPLIPDTLRNIIMDVKAKNEEAIMHRMIAAQEAIKARENRPLTASTKAEEYKEKYINDFVNGVLSDITNASVMRENVINAKSFRAGQYCENFKLDQNETIELLLQAALSTGQEYRIAKSAVKRGFSAGLKKAKQKFE